MFIINRLIANKKFNIGYITHYYNVAIDCIYVFVVAEVQKKITSKNILKINKPKVSLYIKINYSVMKNMQT